jgi:acetyl-CoA acetyltransferase/uncharacterized OB-fold protein
VDGQLWLGWCAVCARHLHPSREHCPYCDSTDLGHVRASGEGITVACTVEPGRLGGEAQAIVVVALTVDPSVRLTAPLADCPEERITVGLPVGMHFDRVGTDWVARFRPRPGQAGRFGPRETSRAAVAKMRGSRFEDRVAITGIGRSPLGPEAPCPAATMALHASRAAITDAGLHPGEIDGVCAFPGAEGLPGVSSGGIRELEQSLGLRPSWHCAGRESSGPAGAIVDSMLAVASGLCRHVLCFTVGVRGPAPEPADASLSGTARVALAASEYLGRYGVGREALGWVAIAARRHAERNPDARRREAIDMSSYLAAGPVSAPLGALDCGLASEGAVAVVVSAADRATHGPSQPVWVDAVGTRRRSLPPWEVGLDSYRAVAELPAAHLWSRARRPREDVDFIAVDDPFTLSTLCWLEALGFCGPGEAADFVAGGWRIGPDGVLPVNPHGGLLGGGSSGNYDNFYEAVSQLRGGADGRQILSARVAVACAADTQTATAMLLVGGGSNDRR